MRFVVYTKSHTYVKNTAEITVDCDAIFQHFIVPEIRFLNVGEKGPNFKTPSIWLLIEKYRRL